MARRSYLFLLVPLLLISCRSNDFQKNPVDKMIRDMTDVPVYSIILYDMNQEGTFFPEYQHQYRILKGPEGEVPEEEITDWVPGERRVLQPQH